MTVNQVTDNLKANLPAGTHATLSIISALGIVGGAAQMEQQPKRWVITIEAGDGVVYMAGKDLDEVFLFAMQQFNEWRSKQNQAFGEAKNIGRFISPN